MKREEIIEYASRYIDREDMVDFPNEGEIFAFLHRELPDNKILKDDEGWTFGGYGQLIEYELDMNAKPVGKWIDVHYLSLITFPPEERTIRLQPPHIVLGKFKDPTLTIETQMVSLREFREDLEDDFEESKILQFPGKK